MGWLWNSRPGNPGRAAHIKSWSTSHHAWEALIISPAPPGNLMDSNLAVPRANTAPGHRSARPPDLVPLGDPSHVHWPRRDGCPPLVQAQARGLASTGRHTATEQIRRTVSAPRGDSVKPTPGTWRCPVGDDSEREWPGPRGPYPYHCHVTITTQCLTPMTRIRPHQGATPHFPPDPDDTHSNLTTLGPRPPDIAPAHTAPRHLIMPARPSVVTPLRAGPAANRSRQSPEHSLAH